MVIKGNCIELMRMKRGLSLRSLGQMIGISASSLSAIEKGRSTPRPQTAKLLCEAFDVEFEELFTISKREGATE